MKQARRIFRTTGLLIALAGITLCLAGTAFAVTTAANHIIQNEVTVSFSDAGGTAQTPVTDTVDITVSLVASAPTLSTPTNLTTDSATPAYYTYELTATANGPDAYDLAGSVTTETAGITGGTSSIDFLYDPVGAGIPTDYVAVPSDQLSLGATTVADATGTIAAAGNTIITVPNDNTNDGQVNGIEGGDFVWINNQLFEVDSVDDSNNSTPNGTSTITVIGNGTATAITITDLIAERQEFILEVTPGTVTDTTTQYITVDITVDGGPPTDQTVTEVTVAALTVDKKVAVDPTNLDDDSGGYADTANAAPGDTLIYRITITNSGSADATSVVITDPAVPFTVYTNGKARASSTLNDTYGSATTSPLTDPDDAPGTDKYNHNVGTGLVTYDVGTIPAGESRLLFFQVTVQE